MRALAERLLAADGAHPIDTHDTDGIIASMLEVDAHFFRLRDRPRLAKEAADVDHVEADWKRQRPCRADQGGGHRGKSPTPRRNALGKGSRTRKEAQRADEARRRWPSSRRSGRAAGQPTHGRSRPQVSAIARPSAAGARRRVAANHLRARDAGVAHDAARAS
jgi:hypothetical protein